MVIFIFIQIVLEYSVSNHGYPVQTPHSAAADQNALSDLTLHWVNLVHSLLFSNQFSDMYSIASMDSEASWKTA